MKAIFIKGWWEDLNHYSVEEFVQKASSKEPVPGGGGVSALAGALGMALGCMVGNLTLGKSKYQEVQPQVIQLLSESQVVQDKLMELVQEDANVFKPLVAAYRLPEDTEEERIHKNDVLQTVLIDATLIPLEIARWAQKSLALQERYEKVGNRMAISDVGVGVALCQAAVKGAKLNVLINTKMITDEKFKKEVETEIDAIEKAVVEQGEALYRRVEEAVR